MGNTWEVHEWYEDITTGGGYHYGIEYSGDSLLKAIWKMICLKRNGASCLKLEWRPQ
jgi:hypothetical protein